MAIPDYQSIMLPFLKYMRDRKEHSLRETVDYLADDFNLTEEERKELLPSGLQAIFLNRVGWARTYLKKARLIESKKRGFFNITQRGNKVLKENPEEINVKYLSQFPEFVEFKTLKRKKSEKKDEKSESTPEELLEAAYQSVRNSLAEELLQNVKGCSSSFFEKLVLDLLVRMGYGGTRKDAGKAVGKSGDEGVDGIIKEDRLGLDIIYIQAKRWENPVGRPDIQKFAGALQGQKAKKGIFITTSSFTKEAESYVSKIDSKIVLIDGQSLAQLLFDHNIGVSQIAAYEVKRMDMDYFIED